MRADRFNRKYVNKRKLIRDRKKAHIVARKRRDGPKVDEVELSKKDQKKQKRLDKIFNEMNIKKNPWEKERKYKKNRSGKYYCPKENDDIEMNQYIKI